MVIESEPGEYTSNIQHTEILSWWSEWLSTMNDHYGRSYVVVVVRLTWWKPSPGPWPQPAARSLATKKELSRRVEWSLDVLVAQKPQPLLSAQRRWTFCPSTCGPGGRDPVTISSPLEICTLIYSGIHCQIMNNQMISNSIIVWKERIRICWMTNVSGDWFSC